MFINHAWFLQLTCSNNDWIVMWKPQLKAMVPLPDWDGSRTPWLILTMEKSYLFPSNLIFHLISLNVFHLCIRLIDTSLLSIVERKQISIFFCFTLLLSHRNYTFAIMWVILNIFINQSVVIKSIKAPWRTLWSFNIFCFKTIWICHPHAIFRIKTCKISWFTMIMFLFLMN